MPRGCVIKNIRVNRRRNGNGNGNGSLSENERRRQELLDRRAKLVDSNAVDGVPDRRGAGNIDLKFLLKMGASIIYVIEYFKISYLPSASLCINCTMTRKKIYKTRHKNR